MKSNTSDAEESRRTFYVVSDWYWLKYKYNTTSVCRRSVCACWFLVLLNHSGTSISWFADIFSELICSLDSSILLFSVPLCKNSDCLVTCIFLSVLAFFIVRVYFEVIHLCNLNYVSWSLFFGRNWWEGHVLYTRFYCEGDVKCNTYLCFI